MRAPLDSDVYMKLTSGCGSKTDQVVRLDRALYSVKQAGHQWAAHLCKTKVDEHDMEQCKSDPCVFSKRVDGVVELIVVVHVDDILVGGEKRHMTSCASSSTRNSPRTISEKCSGTCGVHSSVTGKCTKTAAQSAFVNTLLKHFEVANIPASPAADLGQTTADDEVSGRPFRQVVEGVMWLAGMTRLDVTKRFEL